MANKKFFVELLRGSTTIRHNVFANDRAEAIKKAKEKTSQGNLAQVVTARIVSEVINGRWVNKK